MTGFITGAHCSAAMRPVIHTPKAFAALTGLKMSRAFQP